MPCIRELCLILVSSAILTLAVIQRLLYPLPNKRRVPHTSSTTLSSVHALLAPRNTPHAQLLEERARANGHLARALGLTNTFVDPDPRVHAEFVRHSQQLLKEAQTCGWRRFHLVCSLAVRLTADEMPFKTDQGIPFDHFVQIVVLRTILAGFLNVGRDVDELDATSLGLVSTSINELWTLSKSGVPPPHLSERLHEHLRHLIPIESAMVNPIDFIVPTWETMWRVCASTIAHIQGTEGYETLFDELLQAEASITQQFSTAGRQGFSVRNFIEEAMRLHPPVKRISRLRCSTADTMPSRYSPTIFSRIQEWVRPSRAQVDVSVKEVADIEAVLRDRAIWSDNAHVFEPRRHQASNIQRREAIKLVFGHGPLRCVAASWAPIAAAVICATVVSECREGGWKVIPGSTIGGRLGWDGWRVVK